MQIFARPERLSWRLWSKRNELNNLLLTVTDSPLKCGCLAAGANVAEGVLETVAGLSGHSLKAKGMYSVLIQSQQASQWSVF